MKSFRCEEGLVGSSDKPLRNPEGSPLTPIQLVASPALELFTRLEESADTPIEAHTTSAREGSATTVAVLPPHHFQVPVNAALLHDCQLNPPSRLRHKPMS